MRLTYFWDNYKEKNEIEITSHPINEQTLKNLMASLDEQPMIPVKDIKTERIQKIPLAEIEVISAFGHLTKVHMIHGGEYFLQKRLKELMSLEKNHFYRINNSTILNTKQIKSFSAGSQARLEVYTKTNNQYVVSRHYAKYLKEKLL